VAVRKRYFGLVYMWFLVQLRRQGLVKDRLEVGSYFLYQGDRGWLEVFGGEGARCLVKKVVEKLQELSFNTILAYIGIIFFFVSCLFLCSVFL
jgi:hypothetical protein